MHRVSSRVSLGARPLVNNSLHFTGRFNHISSVQQRYVAPLSAPSLKIANRRASFSSVAAVPSSPASSSSTPAATSPSSSSAPNTLELDFDDVTQSFSVKSDMEILRA